MSEKNKHEHYYEKKTTSPLKIKKFIIGIDKLPINDEREEYLKIK